MNAKSLFEIIMAALAVLLILVCFFGVAFGGSISPTLGLVAMIATVIASLLWAGSVICPPKK